MPTSWWIVAGASVATIGVAFVAVGGHHEIAWWLRRRQRRHELMVDLTRRVRP